jgi:MFS family permease
MDVRTSVPRRSTTANAIATARRDWRFRFTFPDPANFEGKRAASVAAGVAAASMVGCAYAFSIISHPMKAQFHLSQTQIDIVTTVSFMLANFNVLAGWMLDRYGPRWLNFALFAGIAVGMFWLAAVFLGAIPGSVGTLLVGYALVCWPSGALDISTLMPNLYTFPLNRGDVIIIQKTFMGLGSSVFATIFSAAFSDDTVAYYCIFCGISAVVIGVLAGIFTMSGAIIQRRADICYNGNGTCSTAALSPSNEQSMSSGGVLSGGSVDYTRLPLSPHVTANRISVAHPANSMDSSLGQIVVPPELEEVRGEAFRIATTPAPPQAFRFGFMLLAATIGYLVFINVLTILKYTDGWHRWQNIIVAFGAVALVGAFWGLVPVARWHARPVSVPPGGHPGALATGGTAVVSMREDGGGNPTFRTNRAVADTDSAAHLVDDSDSLHDNTVHDFFVAGGDGHARGGDYSDPAPAGRTPPGSKPKNQTGLRGGGGLRDALYLYEGGRRPTDTRDAIDSRKTSAGGKAAHQPSGNYDQATPPSGAFTLVTMPGTNGTHPPLDPNAAPQSPDAPPPTTKHGAFSDSCVPFTPTNIGDVLRSAPFWALYIPLVFQLGTGAVLAANGAQVYRSANGGDFSSTTNAAYTSISGLGSALGRILLGYLDRRYPERSASLYVSVPSLIMAVGLCLFIWLPVEYLAIPYFINALAYGIAWAVAILVVRNCWAASMAGTVYATLFTSGLVGTAIFSLGLFGPLYDKEGAAQHVEPHCNGTQCYRTTFYVLAACNAAGTASGWLFHVWWMRHQRLPRSASLR